MNRHDPTDLRQRSATSVTGHALNGAGRSTTTTEADVPAADVDDLSVEAANTVIQQIFAVGLDLASCAQMVNGVAAERLAAAVDDLDAIIVGVRNTAFHRLSAGVGTGVALSNGHGLETGIDEIIHQLLPLACRVIDLAGVPHADGAAAIHFLGAGHSLYRALIELAAEPISNTAGGQRHRPDPTGILPARSASNAGRHRPSGSLPNQVQGADMATKQATKARTVQVGFDLPGDVAAEQVAVCGEFNNWSPDTKLSRNGDGSWHTTINLAPGAYRYRYLIDGNRWENAWDADDYVANPYGGDDSVIVVD